MEIKKLVVGPLECNCYILKIDNNILVIDPGDNYELINSYIINNNILGILITHNHFDHVGSLNELKNNYQVNIYDKSNLEEKEYQIGPFSFEVIHNPGHSSDSISFYFKKYNSLFVGDFIFKNSIGRCDLPTGDYNQMKISISKLKKYEDNIIIYPGHGEITSLDYEKLNNIYFK